MTSFMVNVNVQSKHEILNRYQQGKLSVYIFLHDIRNDIKNDKKRKNEI
jgi:hypothetical protein